MPRFRLLTLLIFTGIFAAVLVLSLHPVAYSYPAFRKTVEVRREPTSKEVAQRVAVFLPAGLLTWIVMRWWIRKNRPA